MRNYFIIIAISVLLVFSSTIIHADITNSIIDSFDFYNHGTKESKQPDIIQIDSDTYAIVYNDKSSTDDGVLVTVDISSTGDIASSVTETFVFDPKAKEASIVQIDSDTYAIAYNETTGGKTGTLVTVDISSTGDIASSVTETFVFDNSESKQPDIIQIDSDTYAIVYYDKNTGGTLVTVDISSTGDIASSVTETFVFDSNEVKEPSIVQIDSDTYAIAYNDKDNLDGVLVTVDISSTGDIASSVTETFVFDASGDEVKQPDIIQIDSDTYAIAYNDKDNLDGVLVTVDISSTGDIASSVTETFV
ncbi:MAG: hypothetical protein ABGW47_00785, partial [Nitrosopumilus sp.]